MYKKDSKIYNLFERIKGEERLKHLLINDENVYYKCTNYSFSTKFTHLHKCVMSTKEYPFLNEYIDEYLNLYPRKINCRNQIGFTPLILASVNSKTDSSEKTVKILLKHNANVNLQDKDGNTALIISVSKSNSSSSEKTIKLLLNNKANVNTKNKFKRTALMEAAWYSGTTSSINIVKMLLEHNSHVRIQDLDGTTALMDAVRNQAPKETIKMLLKYKSNINVKNKYGDNVKIISMYYIEYNLVPSTSMYHDMVDIILPTRKNFIEEITQADKEIMCKRTRIFFWKIRINDYKILSVKCMVNFNDIINFF